MSMNPLPRQELQVVNLSLNVDDLHRLWDMAQLGPKPEPFSFTTEHFSQAIEKLSGRLMGSGTPLADEDTDLPKLPTRVNPVKGTIETYLPGRGKRILVVDDLGIVIHQLRRRFTRLGFAVDTASGLEEAMAKFQKHEFDYVVMDLLLPSENDGFQLLQTLRQLAKVTRLDPKIIVMSASTNSDYQERALKVGGDHYIEKGADWYDRMLDYLQEH
jgi:CheY-like chemotaxis protein